MKNWLDKIKIGLAVARVVVNPDSKAGKTLEKLDAGSDLAAQVVKNIEAAKVLVKK